MTAVHPQSPAGPVRGRHALAPPTTSFDFLNGGYRQAARTRLISLLVVGTVIAVAIALAGQGVNKMLQVRSTQSNIAATQSQIAAADKQLSTLAQYNGRSQTALQGDLTGRTASADQAVKGEPASAKVLADLNTAAQSVPGAVITGVSFVSTGQQGVIQAGSSSVAPTPSSASSSAPATTLTVTLTLSSYTEAQQWIQAVEANLPYLGNVANGTSVSGSASTIQVTTTGPLAAAVLQAHANEIDGQLNPSAQTPGSGS